MTRILSVAFDAKGIYLNDRLTRADGSVSNTRLAHFSHASLQRRMAAAAVDVAMSSISIDELAFVPFKAGRPVTVAMEKSRDTLVDLCFKHFDPASA